ncbi:hypothetical protein M0Q97_09635 [Candidatus Dojkabacteria bacterium]|jgi:hypothetical protein|nr:hypothetical protein [Candidatus Dojkabacteria bacterium]
MNISVIIPIHEYNDQLSLLVTNAVESVIKQKNVEGLPQILFVYPAELDSNIIEFRDSIIQKHQDSGVTINNFVLIKNNDNSSYQSQVNLAVKSVTTDYFSVLEFDDEYGNTYFKNALKYIENYLDVDVFLSMMIEVNEQNQGIKLTNETVWAQQFVGENGEMGYLNLNSLKQYTDFKLSGAIIKKSEFQSLGGYKNNIKMTFMYEFLLRALNNASKIFSIPKIGYKHLATREGSLFDGYLKNMSVDERKFWFETATKESNFINDRPIDLSRI